MGRDQAKVDDFVASARLLPQEQTNESADAYGSGSERAAGPSFDICKKTVASLQR
jgi:hypothetical protein